MTLRNVRLGSDPASFGPLCQNAEARFFARLLPTPAIFQKGKYSPGVQVGKIGVWKRNASDTLRVAADKDHLLELTMILFPLRLRASMAERMCSDSVDVKARQPLAALSRSFSDHSPRMSPTGEWDFGPSSR